MKICIICPIGWVFFQGVTLGEIDQNSNIHTKAIYIRLADSTSLLVEVFLSDMIYVDVSGKMY